MRSMATPGGIRRSVDFPRLHQRRCARHLAGLAPPREGEPPPRQLPQDRWAEPCDSPGAVLPVITYAHAALCNLCFTSSPHVHHAGGAVRAY